MSTARLAVAVVSTIVVAVSLAHIYYVGWGIVGRETGPGQRWRRLYLLSYDWWRLRRTADDDERASLRLAYVGYFVFGPVALVAWLG
jgi:hypothetical protein